MVQIKWTRLATGDLKDIYDYISKDSPTYAKRTIVRIRARTKVLTRHPQIGKTIPEFDRPDLRELIEGSYRIVYRLVDQQQIDILTIHHSSRDLSKRNF